MGGQSGKNAKKQRSKVRAAGGVIVRAGKREPKVLLIHRPRYDDWSFPKGKLDPGETWKQAARREVREETGLECKLHRPRVPSLEYKDAQGRPKEVRYWVMTRRKGKFKPNDEVDLICWVRASKVVDRLTYGRDRKMFTALLESGHLERVAGL